MLADSGPIPSLLLVGANPTSADADLDRRFWPVADSPSHSIVEPVFGISIYSNAGQTTKKHAQFFNLKLTIIWR